LVGQVAYIVAVQGPWSSMSVALDSLQGHFFSVAHLMLFADSAARGCHRRLYDEVALTNGGVDGLAPFSLIPNVRKSW
jgi:hypothetical protein